MKRKNNKSTAALILLTSLGCTSMPVQAVVTEYQSPDTSTDQSVGCEVYYDTHYDFTIVIPKDKPDDKSGVTVGSYVGVYDGNFHGIIVACETYGAVIYYSTDGGKTYTSERPLYKDIGTYTTYFKVEKDGEVIEDHGTVKIEEADIDYSSSDYSGLYDGKAHGINLTVYTEGCEILYSKDGITYFPEKPEYKETGTYTTYYKVTKDNYKVIEGSRRVIIGGHTIDYTVDDWTGKYDGNPHGITMDVSTEGCEILYSTDGIHYTSERPTYTEVGSYVTYFKIIREGYETVEGNSKVIIEEININLSDNSGTVKVGDSIDFTVDTDGELFDVTVADSDIAKVTVKDGVITVTGLKEGKTKILITCNGKTAEYEITVTDTHINLSSTSGTVKVESSIDFTVDTGGNPFDVTVADPSIAKVTVKDGVVTVTGLKEGKTTITVTCDGKTADYEITVVDTNIKLSDTKGTVKVDDSIKFTVDTDGEPFDVKVVDSSTAKVTVKDGVVTVTGLKEGKTKILITSNGKTLEYEVTVIGTDIKLSDTKGTVKINDSIKFTVDTGGELFDVKVADPSIAKVTVKDGVVTVTGLKEGKTKILITSNGKTVEYEVTVIGTDIKLSDTSGTVKVDDSIKFTVDTDGEPFEVAVADPGIAKVTVKNGVVTVTGLKGGKTTILISCNGKTVKYEITVIDEDIKLSDIDGTVKVDDSIKFTVDTGGKPFDVTISDSSIAKIAVKDGVVTVTGLNEGTATITITCNGKSVTYKINVTGKDNKSFGNSSNSNSNKNSNGRTNVQTGDENNILLYGAMLIASVFGLARIRGRKEKRKL